MRTLIAVAACLFLWMTCRGEGKEKIIWPRSAGIDIFSAANEGALKLSISQQFSNHWSIDASHTIRFRMTKREAASEVKEHYSMLGYTHVENSDSEHEMMTGDLTLSYWLKEGYGGLFIRTGCRTGVEMRMEGILGVGYTIKVWKGLRCSLSYDTTIGNNRKEQLGLTISYVMK